MRAIAAALAVALTLPFSASASEVPVTASAYGDHIHMVESGAFGILGERRAGIRDASYEISLFAARVEETISTYEHSHHVDTGGCFTVFSVATQVRDTGCGTLTVAPDGALGTTRVTGVLDSEAADYVNDPETGPDFINPRPSTITVDLTFTGTGPLRIAESDRSFVGVCGTPPDVRGVSAGVEAPLTRAAVATGTFRSASLGDIDPGLLEPTMMDARYAEAGAEIGGCL